MPSCPTNYRSEVNSSYFLNTPRRPEIKDRRNFFTPHQPAANLTYMTYINSGAYTHKFMENQFSQPLQNYQAQTLINILYIYMYTYHVILLFGIYATRKKEFLQYFMLYYFLSCFSSSRLLCNSTVSYMI